VIAIAPETNSNMGLLKQAVTTLSQGKRINIAALAATRRFGVGMLLVVASLLGVSATAVAADDTNQADAAIEEQLKHGIALRRAGSDDAALAVFLDLEKRAPDSVRLLLHISTAAQAAGKWMMAYEYLQKAATHKDDPYYQRHRASIENVEKSVAQRVGQFRARGSPSGAEVRLNGEAVGTLPMTSIKAIEVGTYMLEVSKQGYYPLRRQVTITGGGALNQETIELHDAKSTLAAAAEGSTFSDGRPAADRGVTADAWTGRSWVTGALAGAGVAAAATSGVAFVVRERKASHWNDNSQCLNPASASRTRDDLCGGVRRDAKLAETIGIAAGIGALTLGTAALIHGLTTGRSSSGSPPATSSGCTPGLGSVVCYGTF
jgi:hypothetical protein